MEGKLRKRSGGMSYVLVIALSGYGMVAINNFPSKPDCEKAAAIAKIELGANKVTCLPKPREQ